MYAVNPYLFFFTFTVYTVNPRIYIRGGRFILSIQLEQFLKYKAQETGSEVLKVSAKYTSQRCPVCGRIHKQSRDHNRHLYSCPCGYKSNDDRVGAMNIQNLGKRWLSGEKNPRYKKDNN